MGFSLLNTLLEQSPHCVLAVPDAVVTLRGDLMRSICMALSTDSLTILSQTCRAAANLFHLLRPHLRVHAEVLLTQMMHAADAKRSSFDKQELLMENLLEFSKISDFLVDLYANYDCRCGAWGVRGGVCVCVCVCMCVCVCGRVCGCDSITHTGSDHELSRQSIYESISYHDAILGRRGKREGGTD